MKTNYLWKIRISYEIFMLFFTLILGILLICECADAYYSNYELGYIQHKFVLLIVPFAVYILGILIGFFICHLIPANIEYTQKIKRRFNSFYINSKRAEIFIKMFCGIFCIGVMIYCIVKFATFSISDSSINSQILDLIKSIAPWIIICFVLWLIVAAIKFPTSKIQKTSFLKFFDNEKFIFTVRIVVLGIAVVFIVLGIINGGHQDVLMKAIKICRE